MSDDKQLKRDVLDELGWEPSVDSAHIGVTAEAGVVTLTGHVGSYAEKCAAEKATRRVNGGKAIAQEIEVRLLFDSERSDDEIATAVSDHLAWDASIPTNAIKVKVEKGWVTLAGEVDSYYQKTAAESDVLHLYGVVSVSNEITIKPRVDVSNISDDIIHALHRSWFFDPKTINVSAQGGTVKLSGTVHNLHDSQVAAATAWSAQGVTWVDNDIVVR